MQVITAAEFLSGGPAGPPGPTGSPGSNGTNATLKSAIIDLGATPVNSGYFTVTDATVTPSSKIIATIGVDQTARDEDENEMDTLDVAIVPYNGSFSVSLKSKEGYVHDKYTLTYTVG